MDSASRSEKPLPRPPSGARYSQRPTFIPHLSCAKGDASENSESEGPAVNEGWSVDSLPASLHREPGLGEELECSSTPPRVNESGVPSATPNIIVRRSTVKTTDFDRGPCSSIKAGFTSTLESPLRTVQDPIPYPETMQKATTTSVRKSYNPNSAITSDEKNEKADHISTDSSQNMTPRARPKKPNPFRERLQSASPRTAPQTPLATTFSYDLNEGDIDQSPTPTYLASRKTGISVPPSPSKEDGKTEPPPRTAKRKSKIPRILSPKVPLNGEAIKDDAEALQKSQETAPANATAIPLPIRSSNSNDSGSTPADISPAVNGSNEAEALSASRAGSEVTDTTGEIEIGEARAVPTTKVSKGNYESTLEDPKARTPDNMKILPGGFKLKQLSIAGRPDGPTLRIDPDAERIIMGKREADKDKKVSKRRSGALRNIRRSTDSLLSSYISSKRNRKSSTDNDAEVSKQLEGQSQPRSFLPVKNLDIVKESPTPGRRTDSHTMSIRTVSETPKENVSPCSNKNGTRPSASIENPNGTINAQHGSPSGGAKNGEPSSRGRETHTLNGRINVNTPAKYSSPIPATPSERAAKEQVPTSMTRGHIPVRQASHASPRTPRREPNERMTFERMGFTNAPSAATPYASNPPLRTVRSETRTMPPKDHSTATTRKSRIPSGIPKTKTRGVFQGFRGLFTKNKSNGSKAAPDIAIGNVNAFASGRGTIGSSPVFNSSPSQRPKLGAAEVLSAVQSPRNLRVPNLHMTQSGPRIDDSPAMQDMSSITNLTMEVLAVARRESEVAKKQKLIAVSRNSIIIFGLVFRSGRAC